MQVLRRVQGRWIGAEEIIWLRHWIDEHPQWSRKRIARQLCECWQWRDARGRLKDFAARSFLLKLQAEGHLSLPPLQVHQRRVARAVRSLENWQLPARWSGSLHTIGPVSLETILPGMLKARTWAFYLHTYHYLGLRVVGENLGYLARDAQGRDLAALLFGAAAWRCATRDDFLGWSEEQRRERLHTLANNTRFLILPWVVVPHLASHLLSAVARRISADWLAKYGHELEWLETFVERERFAGTCYRAANWQCVGQTKGRSRQDRDHRCTVAIKDVYLYRLRGGRR